MKKLLVPIVAIILLLSLIVVGCSSSPSTTTAPATAAPTTSQAAAAKNLDIGEIESLTGLFSDFMKYVPQGAQLASDYVNSHGGITVGGQKYNINLIVQDNKSTPDGSATAANDLIMNKNVKFIAGTGPTPLVIAIDQVTEQAGVLYTSIYSNGTPDEMSPKSPLHFVGGNDSFSAQTGIITYLHSIYPNVKTFAFIQSDDGQIQYDVPVLKNIASKLGMTLIEPIIGFPPPTTDYTPYAQKAVATNADAIVFGNMSTGAGGQFLQGIRGLGYKGPIGHASFPIMPDVVGIAGPTASEGYFGTGVPGDPTIAGLPQITQDVIKAAVAKYGVYNNLQYQGFGAIYSLAQAIHNANSLDPKVVASSWEKMTNIDTIYGPGKMGGQQTYGVNHCVYGPMPVQTVTNGKITFNKFLPLDQVYMP